MLLIDGYNLLYKRGDAQDEGELLQLLYDYCRHFKKRAIVVFDGEWDYDKSDDTRELEIKYVKDADEEIMHLAEKFPGSIVVTSDREIIQRVKQFQCEVVKSQNFNPSITKNDDEKSENTRLTENEAQEYIDWFKS